MSAAELLVGVALWGSSFVALSVVCRESRAVELADTDDVILSGRLIYVLHDEAERLVDIPDLHDVFEEEK